MEKVSNVFRRESYGRMNSQAHTGNELTEAVRSYGHLHFARSKSLSHRAERVCVCNGRSRVAKSQHWLNRVPHNRQSFHVPHPNYRQDETPTLLVLLKISM